MTADGADPFSADGADPLGANGGPHLTFSGASSLPICRKPDINQQINGLKSKMFTADTLPPREGKAFVGDSSTPFFA